MNDTAALPLAVLATCADARLRSLVDAHYAFLHRSLRRLGVPDGRVEDAAQQVLLVTARRLDAIAPAAERAFLFAVALRTASDVRRSVARLREVHDDALLQTACDAAPHADVAIDRSRARRLLDEALDQLPLDLRAVFVLSELEELTMAKIAEMLDIPPGTVASRLRRARERFSGEVSRIKAQLDEGACK